MAKKMTDVERENTKFNVIEVVTEFNVPQSAKVVLSNVHYRDLPKNSQSIQFHILTVNYAYKFSEKELTNDFESKWNDMWESEQRNDFDDYWMGSTAVEHWSTKGKHAMQANNYIFFQMV